MKITFTCCECDEDMTTDLEVEPYGCVRCPQCRKEIMITFKGD